MYQPENKSMPGLRARAREARKVHEQAAKQRQTLDNAAALALVAGFHGK